jgi:hypothetical protein
LHELQTGKVASIEEIAAREKRMERSVNMTLSWPSWLLTSWRPQCLVDCRAESDSQN